MPVESFKMMEQDISLYKTFMNSQFKIFHFNFLIQMDLLDIIVPS